MRRVIGAAILAMVVAACMGSGPAGASGTKTSYRYGSATLQTVTVITSASPDGASVVLIHGGGFRSSVNDANGLTANANSLAAAGATVFIVNYRNDVGGVDIADEVADVVAGTQWVETHAAAIGSDPSRLTMIGGSSGGLLVGDAAEVLDTLAPGSVKTVITLSAMEDFATALSYWQSVTGPTASQHITNLVDVLGCTQVRSHHQRTYQCPADLEAAYSPDLHAPAGSCPATWLIFNGLNEEQPLSQAVSMQDALVAAGCPQTLDTFPGSAHGFDYWSAVLPQIQAAVAAT